MIVLEKINVEKEKKKLVSFLLSQEWPFHVHTKPDEKTLLKSIEEGNYENENTYTYWILDDKIKVGIIRISELSNEEDEYPHFDIRIRKTSENKGIRTEAVKQLIRLVFAEFPKLRRIEATTRFDNIGIQKVLLKAGFTHEATYRKSWKTEASTFVDTYGYTILREDLKTLRFLKSD